MMQLQHPWLCEVCADCGRNNVLGFSVPDEVWQAVTEGTQFENRVLCILCFDALATERDVDWAAGHYTGQPIEFWPISGLMGAS